MMHNPAATCYALGFSRSSSARAAGARTPRTNESAEAHDKVKGLKSQEDAQRLSSAWLKAA